MDYRTEYKRWLEFTQDDPQTQAELKSIADDEQEIKSRFAADLEFGTAGMRGVLGAGLNRMNKYVVRRATQGLAEYILKSPGQAERGVVIAYDSRRFSPEFAKEAALTLCKNGVRAYLFDSLRPVPVLSFSVRKLNAIGGIVITASHNPAEYNGYKVYWEDGGQMPPERAGEVLNLIREIDIAGCQSMDESSAINQGLLTIVGPELDDAYVDMVKHLTVNSGLIAQMGNKIKIVYTPLHGSGNIPVRRVLSEVGFKQVYVVPEQELPDPDFPTVSVPNPEDPSAFKMALELRKKLNADVVIGTDPDCDRVGVAVVDGEDVHILTGNQIACLLLHYILASHKTNGTMPKNAAVVKSIVSTEMARAICADYGAQLFDVLTGFKYIAEKIQQFEETGSNTFVFGFEESYGYLSGTQVRDKDGVNACLLIAEAATFYKKQNMSLYDALQMLFAQYGYTGEKTISFAVDGIDGLEKMARLMADLRANAPAKIGGRKVLAVRDYAIGLRTRGEKQTELDLPKADVLYYELESGCWVCVRPSGTEPKIKLYVNASSANKAETERLLKGLSEASVQLLEELL